MKQLDVLFIEPNSSIQSYQGLAEIYSAIETPTWSLLLAQSCRSKGFRVAILDANAERLTNISASKRVEELNPRLVVFVVYGQNPNSGTTNMSGAISLATELKLLGYKIAFVGSHSSALPKKVLSFDCVDIVLLNEGVYALHNLLSSNLESDLKNIKGIGWKPDNIIYLNSPERIVPQDKMVEDLPGYAWDLLPYNKKPFDLYRSHFWHTNYDHELRTPFAALYTSFGCKFQCQFCMINILNRTNNSDDAVASDFNIMRYWPSEFILKEFNILRNNYGVQTIRISDEMFFLNKQHYEPIINGINKNEYDLRLWAYSRIDTVKKDFLSKFKKAGINWLGIGVESANQTIRQEITKGKFKEIDIREVIKLIEDSDISVGSNYIFGFPNEKLEHLQQTLDLALELNTDFANFYCAAALPGSPLYLHAKKNNFKLPSSFEGYAFYSYNCEPLNTNFLTSKEVLKFRDEAWYTYFTSQKYLNKIESKFGIQNRRNIEEQTKIKLKRKLLGD